jgi:hypothetical protein
MSRRKCGDIGDNGNHLLKLFGSALKKYSTPCGKFDPGSILSLALEL